MGGNKRDNKQFEKRNGVNWPTSQLKSLNGMSTVTPPPYPYRLMSLSVSREKERQNTNPANFGLSMMNEHRGNN